MIGGGPQKITVEIGGKIAASLGASLRSAQMQVSSFGRNVNRTMNDAATAGRKGFKGMFDNALWQQAAAGAAAIGVGMAASVRVAANFEGVLSDIGKTANISQGELKLLSGEILKLSSRNVTNLGPAKLAEGVQDLVAQGLELKDAVASMEALGKVATATNSDLLDVTKTGFQLQNALKIRPTELKATFDALAFAGKQGAFELKDMAQFMPTIAAAAGTLGIQGQKGAVSLAAMMQMVRKDAPDAGQAATRLTDAMLKMTAPDAVKNFKKFGVNIQQVLADAKAKGVNPMEAALSELQRVTGGDVFKLSQIFGDKEAKLALMSLMKYRKEYEKLKTDAGGDAAAGTVDKDYQRSLQTFQGTLASFQSAGQRLGIVIGQSLLPPLTRIAEAITPMVEGFANFAQQNPAIATGIVSLAGAFAGLVLVMPLIASTVSVVSSLGAAITAAGGASVVLGGVFAALTGPIGLTVLAIAGIGAALAFAYQKFGWFRDQVNSIFAGIGSIISGVFNWIQGGWTMLVGIFTGDSQKISQGFTQMLGGVKQVFSGMGQIITGAITGMVAGFQALGSGILAAIAGLPGLVGNIFRGILQVGQMIFAQLPQPVQSAVRTILGIMFPIPAMIIRNWSGIVSGVRGIFNRVVSVIQETPGKVANVGAAVITAILDGLKARAAGLFSWISGTWTRIKGMVGGGGEAPAPAGAARPPGRAIGGPVRAGMPYIVGERRRELFVPGMDGAIIPRIARPVSAAALAGLLAAPLPAAAAGGAVTINAPVTINAAGGDAMEIRRQVELAFHDIQRQIESSHRVLLND